jgi:hypothetical protein
VLNIVSSKTLVVVNVVDVGSKGTCGVSSCDVELTERGFGGGKVDGVAVGGVQELVGTRVCDIPSTRLSRFVGFETFIDSAVL